MPDMAEVIEVDILFVGLQIIVGVEDTPRDYGLREMAHHAVKSRSALIGRGNCVVFFL